MRTTSVLVLAAVLLVGGCTAGDSDSALRLLVLDGSLRRLGEPCDGAGPFRYAHAEAGYVIEDRAGAEVFRGELPGGTAERMVDVAFREGARQPTMCVMTLHVNGLTKPDGHRLLIDDQEGVAVEPSDSPGVVGEVTVS